MLMKSPQVQVVRSRPQAWQSDGEGGPKAAWRPSLRFRGGGKSATNTGRIAIIPSLGQHRCAQPFGEFPPRRRQNAGCGIIHRLTLRRRLRVEEMVFYALFQRLLTRIIPNNFFQWDTTQASCVR